MEIYGLSRCLLRSFKERAILKAGLVNFSSFKYGSMCKISKCVCETRTSAPHVCGLEIHPQHIFQFSSSSQLISWRNRSTDSSQTTLVSVIPVFSVMRYDSAGNVNSFERKKTELYHELGLQARDLRFQHLTSINTRNNCIILRMEIIKAVITPEYLLILDYRQSNLEQWFLKDLALQLTGEGHLVTHSLPFEFRAIEAILQHRINFLQSKLNELQPRILETLEALVDHKQLSIDRSKLHVLLQASKNLSELETDIKVFKEALLEILDEEKQIEELCLSKWNEQHVCPRQSQEEKHLSICHIKPHKNHICFKKITSYFSKLHDQSNTRINPAEEMELLLESYYRQAEDLANSARELKVLIDDSESIIFINLDSHRNVMMRLNLQLTMGTFSVSLFGILGVAFGMNLESSFEEMPPLLKKSQLIGGRIDLRHGSK
ncbi:magnesium transporter MRS2 homolog, mitochondrial isoform X3 [Stegostoma tigrinum]|uniref:magnesium transporter MRS2 homolog, mitochondrial isoform X3 n=1 Tax=Stegostoma tigrinum TaxID=3053191 RepID=UPI00202B79F6|nr:magnesium transporter MRS2 homolog, mitochondrial isoform X3 [Stegostoma tigrinum]